MVAVTQPTTLGVPGTPDGGTIQQDQPQVSGQTANRLTNRYTDFSGTTIDEDGLIPSSSIVVPLKSV